MSKKRTDPRIWRGKHVKACVCPGCLERKRRMYEDRVAEMFSPRTPDEPGVYVPVRGHFRRQKNYLSKKPEEQEMVLDVVRRVMKEGLFGGKK